MRQPPGAETAGGRLSASAYREIRNFMYVEAGIDLGPAKQNLVTSRLHRRLSICEVDSYDAYAAILGNRHNHAERQAAIDLLSTHETYFFREPEHFAIMRRQLLASHTGPDSFRAWSAACSSGEEPYSIAMVLSDHFGDQRKWEVVGSDISSSMVKRAQQALYPLDRSGTINPDFLKRYCLKGIGDYKAYLRIDRNLRQQTRFHVVNLVKPLPDLGLFDTIFFRNAMIYFDDQTKQSIVRRLLAKLRRGGILFIGHSESLKRMDLPLELIAPTAYRKT